MGTKPKTVLYKSITCGISWNSSVIILVVSLPCVDMFGMQQSSQPGKLRRGTASQAYHNLDCKDSRFVQVFFMASLTHSERRFERINHFVHESMTSLEVDREGGIHWNWCDRDSYFEWCRKASRRCYHSQCSDCEVMITPRRKLRKQLLFKNNP